MERIRIIAAGFLSLIAVAPSWAASCDLGRAPPVPVIKNLAYTQARGLVLAGGWAPVPGKPHNGLSDNEASFRERGFAELQFCRMSDDSLCRFEFRAASGILLWVTTSGDENPALGSEAVVHAAKLSCADEPDPG